MQASAYLSSSGSPASCAAVGFRLSDARNTVVHPLKSLSEAMSLTFGIRGLSYITLVISYVFSVPTASQVRAFPLDGTGSPLGDNVLEISISVESEALAPILM